jgi:hypothetical protein
VNVNGERYEKIKPLAPRGTTKCSKRPLSISWWTAVRRTIFSRTKRDTLASDFAIAAEFLMSDLRLS